MRHRPTQPTHQPTYRRPTTYRHRCSRDNYRHHTHHHITPTSPTSPHVATHCPRRPTLPHITRHIAHVAHITRHAAHITAHVAAPTSPVLWRLPCRGPRRFREPAMSNRLRETRVQVADGVGCRKCRGFKYCKLAKVGLETARPVGV